VTASAAIHLHYDPDAPPVKQARFLRDLQSIVQTGELPDNDCAEEGISEDRLSLGEWSALVERSAEKAWKRTGEGLPYTTIYRLVDEALREAMPDVVPEDGRNG
jgi:hypothetical protein